MAENARDLTAGATSAELECRTRRDGSLTFGVKAQARAKREGVVALWNGCVKVAVREAAEAGRANAAIAGVLAEALGVAKSALVLESGASSSQKTFAVSGLDERAFRARIQRALAAR